MDKLKVLVITVDVTQLTPSEIESLQVAMESQVQDVEEALILNSGINEIDPEELFKDDNDLH